MNTSVFRVGITRDFVGPDGTSDLDDIAGPLFDQAGLHWEYIAENTPVLKATQVQDYDALLVLGAGITAETFTDADRLAIIARFGVGYDKVDVEACTENGVLLTIAPDGVAPPGSPPLL